MVEKNVTQLTVCSMNWPETSTQWILNGSFVLTYLFSAIFLVLIVFTEPGYIPPPPTETQTFNATCMLSLYVG